MIKLGKNSVIWIALFWIICYWSYILFHKNTPGENNIIFAYPGNQLTFANEEVPDLDENYFIKERFDKEFLNVSYNLYQFFLYVKRLPLYMPYIEEQLEEYNIPDDFKYLPIAESALRNDVVSSAGAWWIWQFMPETAKEYGLVVNEFIDERYNFEKSTRAALKYIDYLHTIFNDRALVAASYNRWQNGILKAMENQNVENYYDLYLNEETSRYVFRILAIKYVLKDYEEKKSYINQIIGWQYSPTSTEKITVGKIDDLQKWAIEKWYNYQNIKNLNPWILQDSLPEWEWTITLLKE